MLAEPVLQQAPAAWAPPATALAAAPPPCAPQLWLLRSDTALCEAGAVRLLARMGLVVRRRAWLPAACAGGSPALLLLTAPASWALVQTAAQALRERTRAEVQLDAAAPAAWREPPFYG